MVAKHEEPIEQKAALRVERGRRLALLREKAALGSQADAVEFFNSNGINVKKGTYVAYEQGKRLLPDDVAKQIAILIRARCPDVSWGWLLTGENAPEWDGAAAAVQGTAEFVLCQRLDLREAAIMATTSRERFLAIVPKRLEPVTVIASRPVGPRAVLIGVEDESMVPAAPFERDRFYPQDTLLIDPDQIVKPGEYGVFLVEGHDSCVFRQLRLADNSTDASRYILHALNPAFPSYEIGPERSAHHVGKMVRAIRLY